MVGVVADTMGSEKNTVVVVAVFEPLRVALVDDDTDGDTGGTRSEPSATLVEVAGGLVPAVVTVVVGNGGLVVAVAIGLVVVVVVVVGLVVVVDVVEVVAGALDVVLVGASVVVVLVVLLVVVVGMKSAATVAGVGLSVGDATEVRGAVTSGEVTVITSSGGLTRGLVTKYAAMSSIAMIADMMIRFRVITLETGTGNLYLAKPDHRSQ